jgi:hypothetical protein
MDSNMKAIANQKVFVTLSSVMEVQANFNRLLLLPVVFRFEEQVKGSNRSSNDATTRNHVRGMAQVIRLLGLPIDIPAGL